MNKHLCTSILSRWLKSKAEGKGIKELLTIKRREKM